MFLGRIYADIFLTSSPSPRSTAIRRPLEEISWTEYFDQELYLEKATPSGKIVYHVYLTPPSQKAPLFVTHHGAGSSGLSFAVLAPEIRRVLPGAGVLSLDARGHGETVVHDTKATAIEGGPGSGSGPDLSLPVLSDDMLNVISLTQKKMDWQELPGLILVGHSLGGAVVTDVAYRGGLKKAVLGYAVLDVVEGIYNPRAIRPRQCGEAKPSTKGPQSTRFKACSHTCRLVP